MAFFPIQRPRLGLSVDTNHITLTQVRRDWGRLGRRLKLQRSTEREIASGLVRPSATELNISDVQALAAEIRALCGSRRRAARIKTVGLSLPDLCARVALLDFEHVPRKAAELDALVRWRFQKDLNASTSDARLAYRLFHVPPEEIQGSEQTRTIRARVLAVVIRNDIISQYEQACEAANLLPVNVGLASLRLFDLCRPVMKTPRELFFLHRTNSGFAFLAFRQGCPVFVRVKSLRNGSAHATTSPNGGRSLVDEMVATLQFYTDTYPRVSQGEPGKADDLRPLFIVGDHDLPTAYARSLGIQVHAIGLKNMPCSKARRTQSAGFSCLPALASVLET